MNEPINTPDPGRPINVGSEGRARTDQPAELDPAMVEKATAALSAAGVPALTVCLDGDATGLDGWCVHIGFRHRTGTPAPVVPDSPDVRERVDVAIHRVLSARSSQGLPVETLAERLTDAVLAVVGQGVTAEPLKVEWGVVLDDDGSTDVYESREQAEAMAVYADGVCEVVRIETWPHTPAVVRPTGQEQADG